MRYTPTVLALTLLLPAGAAAQATAAPPVAAHDQILSTNPFGLMFKWVNGEYERRVSGSTTVGGSGSYFVEEGSGNAAAFVRWYPQGAALEGFYMGARAGAFDF